MSKKTSIVGFLVMVLLLAGAGAFFAMQDYQELPKDADEQATTTPSLPLTKEDYFIEGTGLIDFDHIPVDTSKWETFNNGEIEFKHPVGWEIEKRIDENGRLDYIILHSPAREDNSIGFSISYVSFEILVKETEIELDETTIYPIKVISQIFKTDTKAMIIGIDDSISGGGKVLINDPTRNLSYIFSIYNGRPIDVYLGVVSTFKILAK